MSRVQLPLLLTLILLGAPRPVSAQAPLTPADGVIVQTTMTSTIDLASATSAAPAFVLGARTGNLIVGAGVGITLASLKLDGDTLRGRAITIAPALQYDVWESTDGRVRGAVSGSLGVGFIRGRGRVSGGVLRLR